MNNKLIKSPVVLTFSYTLLLTFLLSFISCSRDKDEIKIQADPNVEKLDTYVKSLTALRDSSSFGPLTGQYPVESKEILTPAISEANKYILLLKYGETKPGDTDLTKCYADIEKAVADFKASVRIKDVEIPAALYVNGMNGGYIDFGSSQDYATFGNSGSQQFTVELWVKFTNINGFGAVVTTFYENGTSRVRKGWMVNHFNNQKLRMSYAMSTYDNMIEPETNVPMVDYGNQWVHFAAVYSDIGFDGEKDASGKLIVSKIYRNGDLKTTSTRRNESDKYVANDVAMPMTAFLELKSDGSTTRKISGFIKDFHIWKTAKSMTEVNKLMNKETTVSGTEADLVCGWDFHIIPKDNNNIKDLTGKHSARLLGDYQWQRIE